MPSTSLASTGGSRSSVIAANLFTKTTFVGDGKLHQGVLVKFTSWQARIIFYNARKKSKFQVNAALTGRLSDLLAYAKRTVNDQESLANKIVNYV